MHADDGRAFSSDASGQKTAVSTSREIGLSFCSAK
jgi:hypothetical protein